MKEEERKAKLQLLETFVEKVTPLQKKLTPDQENANKIARAQNKPDKFEREPYFAIKCAGEITVYAWNKHVFRAVTASQNKQVAWRISRNKAGSKDYINLEEVVSQGGVPFMLDPETKDWVPVSGKTIAPESPDKGESAPVTIDVDKEGKSVMSPPKEEVFPAQRRRV